MSRLLLFFSVLNLCSSCLSLSAEPTCTEEQTCSAICDGKKIDISFLFHKLSIEDNRGYTYVFSCNGDSCGTKNTSTAICQRRNKDSYSCGTSNASSWSVLSTDPFTLNISYFNGDILNKKPRASFINLTVDPILEGEPERVFTGEEGGFYTFRFTVHSLSKPKSRSHSVTEGYIGWILISLSLIAFLLYFLIGGIVLRFKRGARGLEVIPNVVFWASLPFLIKDGFVFTISPLYNKLKRTRGYEKL